MRESLIHFFSSNMAVVLFAYGLSFFAMGLAISLQSRRPSELRFARHLPLLGTFGVLHALANWGQVFIPIQSTYTPATIIIVLQSLHAILTALAFTALLAFGANLVVETRRHLVWLRYVPEALAAIWGVSFLVYPLLITPQQYPQWLQVSDTWARYMLGTPGALLTAWALALQFEEFQRLGMGRLVRRLEWAVFSFVAYALAGGLVVPPAGFFPSTVLNTEVFFQLTGVPVEVLRGITGVGMAYFMIRVMESFDIEGARRLEEVQAMRAVLAERDRIARDLHDGVIQSLYALGLGLENLAYELEAPRANAATAPSPAADRAIREPVRAQLHQLMARVNEIIQEVRSYILELRQPEGSAPSLVDRLNAVIREASRTYRLPVLLDVKGLERENVEPGLSNEVCQIVREAVSNAARHGQPRSVQVGVHRADDELVVFVQDDGKGFDVKSQLARPTGYGLSNMRRRADLLGGELDVDSRPGEGTTLIVRVPLPRTAATGVPAVSHRISA